MTKLTESQIRAIAEAAKDELGEEATYEQLHAVVSRVVEQMEASASLHPDRLLIICLSLDNRRNAEALSEGLKDTGCKIEDRVERIMGPFHVLLAQVDVAFADCDFEELKCRLAEAGSKGRVKIIIQREDLLHGSIG
jgi:predicted amino acid-binding ACT domain protein